MKNKIISTNTPLILNDVGASIVADTPILHDTITITNNTPYRPLLFPDYESEITALKKEIQLLKDMLSEHILLGHGETK